MGVNAIDSGSRWVTVGAFANSQEIQMFFFHAIVPACALACFASGAIAQSNFLYNARIQCGNSSATNNEYFRASNDMEARNEVTRLLNNNTGYRGKGCRLIELTSDAPRGGTSTKSYEVRIQCGGSSSGSMHYFSAPNDLEAENEARRILNNNTGYRGKNCQVTEMRSR